MASLSSGRPAVVAILSLLLLHLAWTNGEGGHLEIFPNGDVISKSSGGPLMLTCRASGQSPDLVKNMQWMDPLKRVIETEDYYLSKGPTKPKMYTIPSQPEGTISLIFAPLTEELDGRYTCVATYGSTETINKSVVIESIDAISFKDTPIYQYPILGKEFKIKCQVSARPAPTVTWRRGTETITTNEHYVIETHGLKINKVDMTDEGPYICQASVMTTGELKKHVIHVEVHEMPVIEEEQGAIEIIEGKDANIPCKARGKPPPDYSWVQALTKKNLSNADRFSVDGVKGILTITNVQRSDSGEYQCIAQNTVGEASDNVRIDVIGKPKIMEFTNRTVAETKEIQITCRAFGRPPPEVSFRKQTFDKPFTKGPQLNDDRIEFTALTDNGNGETLGTLTIRNVSRNDDGIYECIAKNKVAAAYLNGHLTVEYAPSFALMDNRTIFAWDRKPVNLTCIAQSIPNATIRWTVGDIPLDQALGKNLYKIIDNGPISTLSITPHDKRFYKFYKCHANNKYGERTHIIELREAQAPSVIQQVTNTEITATTVTFNIVAPHAEPELPIRSIMVQFREENQHWADAKNKTWTINSPYVLENLKPETSYSVRFLATNAVGNGNWNQATRFMTPVRTIPNAPKIRMRTQNSDYDISKFSSQYEISWIIPPDNGEPIDQYDIRYCEVKRTSGNWEIQDGTCKSKTVTGQRSDFWLQDLIPDTFYQAEVKAHNAMGYGSPGIARFRTARATATAVLQKAPLISNTAIIGIVTALLFIMLVIIDIICCCAHNTGIIFYICERSRRKPVDEEDSKQLGSLYGWRFPLPYCDQKMANVAGVTAIQDSGSGKNTIKLVKHTAIEEKEPLKEEKKITPIIDTGLRRETSITFDGKRLVSKTGFVGKDSAV